MASPQEEEINIYLKVTKTVALKVKRSETIKSLKALLHEKEGIPEIAQELFFNGDRLDDSQKLVDYGIQRNSTLHLFHQNLVSLNVKIPSNEKTIVVEAMAHDTVQSIKSRIQAKEGIHSDQFFLVCDGKLLEDNRTLASLNMKSKSTLHLLCSSRDVLSITVKAPTRQLVKLEAKALSLVHDVKAIVQSMMGISDNNWNLVYSGNQLENCKTLAYYDIREDCVLEMLPPSIQIFIKTWSGKTITIDVQPCDTIKDVKGKVFEKLKIPVHLQKFVFAGKQLEEDLDLASYNIQKHCTLCMVIAPSARVIKTRLNGIFASISRITTVRYLKFMIQHKMQAPVKAVLFRQEALLDDHDLRYYGIDGHSEVTLVF